MAIVRCIRGGAVIESSLQYACGEVDGVHRWLVIGVHRGRCHRPLALVDGPADLVKLVSTFKLTSTDRISQAVAGLNRESGIVTPLIRVADLVDDSGQLLLGLGFGSWSHPFQLIEVATHR